MSAELRQIGPRLRAARRHQGLTLDDVASRAGMSVSTLSRLESGKRQANLELLVPLTRSLGLRLDDLVRPETPDPRVRQAPIQRNGMLIVPLTPPDAPVQTFKITFPVRGVLPAPRTHDGYEWFYVLSGRLRLLLGEREFVVGRGEAAEFDTGIPHSLAAIGARPAEVISIFNADGARIHTHDITDQAS